MNENAIIRTVPAAGALHKVPGFDPLRHLKKGVNDLGEPVMKLELRYKRLWFRMACPNGRLLLNPLRVTDQMAIFEAQVFFQREDPTPASSFTSTKTVQESHRYIRAAQDEALSIALDNAGFGIQLCDVAQGAESGKPAPVSEPAGKAADDTAAAPGKAAPASSSAQAVKPTVVNAAAPEPKRQAAAETPAPVPEAKRSADTQDPIDPPGNAQPAQRQVQAGASAPAQAPAQEPRSTEPPVQTVRQEATAVDAGAQAEQANGSASAQTAPETVTSAAAPSTREEVSAPHEQTAQPAQRESAAVVLDFAAQKAAHNAAPASSSAQAAPGYSEDMPVEEIGKLMTMDQARETVVGSGTCKGWTLQQVAEKRPSSLKFFVTPFYEAGNVFKAAASLMLQELNQQKAG